METIIVSNQDAFRPPKAMLLDLDGTLYRGDEPVEGAAALIGTCEAAGVACWYVTNNSTRTPEQVAVHLRGLGIPAEAGRVVTSAMAAAHYAGVQYPQAKAYVVGEHGLRAALREAGLAEAADGETVDLVVQGLDRSMTYETIRRAADHLRAGAGYVQTNPDLRLPVEGGFLPGAGSIGAMLQAASGREPVVVGKPSRFLIDYALALAGVDAADAWVVGDNPHTDLAAGAAAGCPTVLVLTGWCTAADWRDRCAEAGAYPDAVCAGPAQVGQWFSRIRHQSKQRT